MSAIKSPAATKPFTIDVAADLDVGEAVTAFNPTVQGAVLAQQQMSDTLLTVWISGGVTGTTAVIEYVFTTNRPPRVGALTLRVQIGPEVISST